MNRISRFSRSFALYGLMATLSGCFSLSAMGATHLATSLPGTYAQISPPPYPYHADTKAQIHHAFITAGLEGKRVLINFGANSCQKCKLFDTYLDNYENSSLLKYDYVLVNVNVGDDFDQNLEHRQRLWNHSYQRSTRDSRAR